MPGQGSGNGNGKPSEGKGKRVLVTAADGGVGILVVHLAKLAGAYVVGTCGSANADFMRGLGAYEVLDYRTTSLWEWVRDDEAAKRFDFVLDCVGGETLRQAWKAARENGVVISVAEPADGKRPEDDVAEGVRSR
ncbi:putative Zinc-binding oxidoreductase [Seiridium unicorne]|uniref:Zinc-binding oxidoreductase n=1 Tax=Seiridium unicorne TaxID=138068 RepID=A0ABR2UZZ6_9PEZI